MKIALVSTPWPLFNRPSIQLATLKAYLREHLPGAQVHAHHFYLNIAAGLGYGLYTEISESTRLSEIPYAALLFPELGEEMERLWRRATRGAKEAGDMALSQVRRALERESLRALESVAWDGFDLVGLSICLGQLTSSLYFIREIKRLAPGSRVVVGGSSCAGELGRSLMTAFPAIDHVIFGEGERPMLHLAREAASGKSVPSPFPGLLSPGDPVSPQGSSQVEDPDTLPMPDFDDYFSTLQSLPHEKAFHPRIPLEMSRGCWWRGADPDGERGCAFCNLNLQWKDYRYKTAEKVANEIEHLASRHATTKFFFVDNNLPLWETDKLFRHIEKHRRSYQIFLETRASVTKKTLLLMRRAGVEDVQIGIEGLSTSYLNRIGKGTTTIQNIEIMKNCEELGINNISNLLIGFPGATEAEVEETLEALEYVFIYKPLRIVKFWLGYNSPVYYRAKDLGLKNIRNHPNYRYVISEDLYSNLELMQKDYRFDKKKQEKIWRPVVKKVKEWKEFYRKTKERYPHIPILKYRDAKNFLIISRVSYDSPESECFRLRGASRDIYKFCDKTRSFGSISVSYTHLTLPTN